jgi:hypothetical protein
MSENNPIVIALREFFGPLIKLTSKLPAPLAYGAAIVLAILGVALLGVTFSDRLVWLLGVVILACLVAFIFADWRTRQAAITPELTDTDPLPLEKVHFEEKIELIKDDIQQLHSRYNQKGDGIIPPNSLLPILRGLFNRKTFDEPIAQCLDENWHDRLCATVQVEYILNKYWRFVKEGAAFVGDERRLHSYENVQRELRRYSQDLTGMFRPHPIVADVEKALLGGKLAEQREQLRNSRIIPRSKVPKPVIQDCDAHRQAILQEIKSWPTL